MDPQALVYRHGDRVLRAIRPGHEAFYEELLNSSVTKELVASGLLLPVKKSTVQIEGHTLVLEQPVITPVTFPFEWASSMFKHAAMALLKLNIKLMEHGYCTQDGHLWNFLFEGAQPRFIDFSSIIKLPANGNWPGDSEFEVTCLSTLRLMEKGYATEARALLREVRANPDPSLANAVLFNTKRYKNMPKLSGDWRKLSDVAGYFGGKFTNRLKNGGKKEFWRVNAEKLQAWLELVESINVQPTHEIWSDYYAGAKGVVEYNGTRASAESLRQATPKHTTVTTVLERTKPKTVLDIACNRGLYSQLAAFSGAKVVGVDNDEQALDSMFHDIAKEGTAVQPLYLNVLYPAEAVSFRDKPFPSVVTRISAECVFCLALTHHFVFNQPHLRFPQIAKLISDFSTRNLLVEFVPKEDRALSETLAKRSPEFRAKFDWYTLENYEAAFAKHFRKIERFDSHPSPRVLLFCQDKITG